MGKPMPLQLMTEIHRFFIEAEALGIENVRAAALLQMEGAIATHRGQPVNLAVELAAVARARVRLEELCWNG